MKDGARLSIQCNRNALDGMAILGGTLCSQQCIIFLLIR